MMKKSKGFVHGFPGPTLDDAGALSPSNGGGISGFDGFFVAADGLPVVNDGLVERQNFGVLGDVSSFASRSGLEREDGFFGRQVAVNSDDHVFYDDLTREWRFGTLQGGSPAEVFSICVITGQVEPLAWRPSVVAGCRLSRTVVSFAGLGLGRYFGLRRPPNGQCPEGADLEAHFAQVEAEILGGEIRP